MAIKKIKITKIYPFSLVKNLVFIFSFLGFICGLFIAIPLLVILRQYTSDTLVMVVFFLSIIVSFILLNAAIGSIIALLIADIFNLSARRIGGVEMEIEK